MKQVMILGVILALLGTAACSKRKPLVPLAMIGADATPQVVTLTEQGTQAFNTKQFEEAKKDAQFPRLKGVIEEAIAEREASKGGKAKTETKKGGKA